MVESDPLLEPFLESALVNALVFVELYPLSAPQAILKQSYIVVLLR